MSRLAAVCLLLFASAALAREITVEDYFSIASVTDLAVSPDGKMVAYCEARWDKGANNRRADLWAVPTDGAKKPVRLTFDRCNARSPRWSADGKSVYFLANRKRAGEKAPLDGKPQVWSATLEGGKIQAATRVAAGVSLFDYAPGANDLFYTVDSKKSDDDDFAKLRKEFSKLDYGHGRRQISEVYRLALDSWRETKVVSEGKYVRELAATRDGKRLAMITASDDSVVESEGRSRVEVWDQASEKVSPTDESWRKKAASPYPWLESLAWSAEGDKLAYVAIFDAYPAEIIYNTWADGKASARTLARPSRAGKEVHVRGYGTPLRWQGGALLWLAEQEGSVWVEGGDRAPEEIKKHVSSLFDVSADGKTAVEVIGTASALPEIAPLGKPAITLLNPQSTCWELPTVKHITWKSTDGTTVGGVLELPHRYPKGAKLPLVVGIHGGPTTAVRANLEFNPYEGRAYLAARGYAVLCPNYRGSTGYGDKFVTGLVGNENDVDVKDILAGVEHLIKQGVVDPERVAVMGWSNGGYLTNCLITLKNPPVKFKAASSGAGILDTVAEWGFNDEPAYPYVFKKGTPWEVPDTYKKTSPTYGLGHVTTPTLIHVGGNDVRCPPGHSRMLYRALREYRKVPTELVTYPGEPHGLARYDSRLAKMKWDVAWFEKYVLGKKKS